MASLIIFAVLAVFSAVTAHSFYEYESEGRSHFEFGDKFQGDILLSPEQKASGTRGSRTGILSSLFRWPKNDKGKVHLAYTIQETAGFSE